MFKILRSEDSERPEHTTSLEFCQCPGSGSAADLGSSRE